MTPPTDLTPIVVVIFLVTALGSYLGCTAALWNKKLEDRHEKP